MTTITALPLDVLTNISKFLDFKEVCHSERVCKVWLDVMRQPGVWIHQSQNEMFPLVNEPNRDRKDDFKVLFPITLSKRRAACLGEYVDDPVPMISREEFDLLKGDDPFDREQNAFSPSAAGSKRTHDQAFSVKKMHETFAVVVEPRLIRRKFEMDLLGSLKWRGCVEIKEEDNFLRSAWDIRFIKDFIYYSNLDCYEVLELDEVRQFEKFPWEHCIERAYDKKFFTSLKIFIERVEAVDNDVYKSFMQSLCNDCKLSFSRARQEKKGEKGTIVQALEVLLASPEGRRDDKLYEAFNGFLESLNDKEDCMLFEALIKALFGWTNEELFPLENGEIQGAQDLIIPYSRDNLAVLSRHALVDNKEFLHPFQQGRRSDLKNSQMGGRVLCSNPDSGDLFVKVYELFAKKVKVSFIRREVPAQSCGLTFRQQEALMAKHGFKLPFLRLRTFFNAVEVLNNGTCPDSREANTSRYTRTCDWFTRDYDEKGIPTTKFSNAFIGDFIAYSERGNLDNTFLIRLIGLIRPDRNRRSGFHIGLLDPDEVHPFLGAVPCLPVGNEPRCSGFIEPRSGIHLWFIDSDEVHPSM